MSNKVYLVSIYSKHYLKLLNSNLKSCRFCKYGILDPSNGYNIVFKTDTYSELKMRLSLLGISHVRTVEVKRRDDIPHGGILLARFTVW